MFLPPPGWPQHEPDNTPQTTFPSPQFADGSWSPRQVLLNAPSVGTVVDATDLARSLAARDAAAIDTRVTDLIDRVRHARVQLPIVRDPALDLLAASSQEPGQLPLLYTNDFAGRVHRVMGDSASIIVPSAFGNDPADWIGALDPVVFAHNAGHPLVERYGVAIKVVGVEVAVLLLFIGHRPATRSESREADAWASEAYHIYRARSGRSPVVRSEELDTMAELEVSGVGSADGRDYRMRHGGAVTSRCDDTLKVPLAADIATGGQVVDTIGAADVVRFGYAERYANGGNRHCITVAFPVPGPAMIEAWSQEHREAVRLSVTYFSPFPDPLPGEEDPGLTVTAEAEARRLVLELRRGTLNDEKAETPTSWWSCSERSLGLYEELVGRMGRNPRYGYGVAILPATATVCEVLRWRA